MFVGFSVFFGGKSRAAAILIAGLLALDPERRLRYQLICKENTGTKSFIEVLLAIRQTQEKKQEFYRSAHLLTVACGGFQACGETDF